MPRGQPFTVLCQQAARLGQRVVADLHTHTTASDGDFSPSQVVAFARQAGLSAVAVTDHDTTTGVLAAIEFARQFGPSAPAVVPGVEVTAEHAGRELHVLGLWVRPDDPVLTSALADVCQRRRTRFREYVRRLAGGGVTFVAGAVEAVEAGTVSLGRRHVAGLLVRSGVARNRFGAFNRFLIPLAGEIPAAHRTPLAEAVELIHAAGGVAVLAHPPTDADEAYLCDLQQCGLDGIEGVYPAAGPGVSARLRHIADRLKLVVTGGSDCHGADPPGRGVGSRGLSRAEWDALAGFVRSSRSVAAGG